MPKRDLYEIQGDKVIRKRRTCPKCGEGTFLARHKDRESCGKCGYTEFIKKEAPAPKAQVPA
jgi:small subunit ribosomal protein S27Ae